MIGHMSHLPIRFFLLLIIFFRTFLTILSIQVFCSTSAHLTVLQMKCASSTHAFCICTECLEYHRQHHSMFKQQQEQQRDIIIIIVINYFTKQHLKTYLFQVPLTLSVGQPSYVPWFFLLTYALYKLLTYLLKLRIDSQSGCGCITTLGKLFTLMFPQCQQSSLPCSIVQ